MPLDTTDVRSNAEAQIQHAVNTIARSESRCKVFKEIYRGKSKGKNSEQIANKIGIPVIRVLQEALVLYKAKIIGKKKINGRCVSCAITVTNGQMRYEFRNLLHKLRERDLNTYTQLKSVEIPEPHPLFTVVEGSVESW